MTVSSTESPMTSATCVLKEPGSFHWETRKISQRCVGREVLVKVIATGICGSDVHYWKHGRIGEFVIENPIVLGHESAGIVQSCGPDVHSVKVGDRVALEVGTSCLTCDQCRAGKYNLCGRMRFAATPPYDGTLAEFYRLPEECCWKLPDHVTFEEGALAEPLAVAVHSAKLGSVSPSTSVVIFGAGTVGLLCGAVAKAFGATDVIMVDITQSRLDFAREYLQIQTYHGKGCNGGGFEANALLAQLGCIDGADVVIDATGAEVCIANGLKSLRRGGCFVQVGLGPSDIKFSVGLVCSKEAVFKGSFRYGPGDYRLAIDLLAKGRVNVDRLVTDRYNFVDIEQAFTDTFNQKGIKNIIYGPGDY